MARSLEREANTGRLYLTLTMNLFGSHTLCVTLAVDIQFSPYLLHSVLNYRVKDSLANISSFLYRKLIITVNFLKSVAWFTSLLFSRPSTQQDFPPNKFLSIIHLNASIPTTKVSAHLRQPGLLFAAVAVESHARL